MDIAIHPERFGWRTSLLTAAIVVPVTGVSAMLTDVNRFLLKRSDDEAWDRGSPLSDSNNPDPDTPPERSDASPAAHISLKSTRHPFMQRISFAAWRVFDFSQAA